MEIIGHGMIARSLEPYRERIPDAVIFASGVANSVASDHKAYEREYSLLADTLHYCQQQNKRIVYFSSGGAIYGATNGFRSETTPTFPNSPYGRHKLLCEAMITGAEVSFLLLRLANLVGASQNASQLIPSLMRQVRNGSVTVFTKATRDLLDIEDFAHLLVCLLETNPQSALFTLASGQSIPVLAIAEEIRGLSGLQAKFELIDGGDEQRFDIGKLSQALPLGLSFEYDYFRRVLAKYVPEYLSK